MVLSTKAKNSLLVQGGLEIPVSIKKIKKSLSDVHSILLDAVENDFQLVIQKESYEITSDL